MWVRDAEEGWVKGVVEAVAATALDVKLESGKVQTFKPEDCPLQNPTARLGVEVSSATRLLQAQGQADQRTGSQQAGRTGLQNAASTLAGS